MVLLRFKSRRIVAVVGWDMRVSIKDSITWSSGRLWVSLKRMSVMMCMKKQLRPFLKKVI